jgi:hypothetical protein
MAKVAVASFFGSCISTSGFEGMPAEARTFCFIVGIHLSSAGCTELPKAAITMIRSMEFLIAVFREQDMVSRPIMDKETELMFPLFIERKQGVLRERCIMNGSDIVK